MPSILCVSSIRNEKNMQIYMYIVYDDKSLRIVHNTETKMIKQIRQQEIARICNHEDI